MSTDKYDDIIMMPHHVSPTHKRMSMHDRASQFAPFAALTGYDGLVEETARLTDSQTELGDHDIGLINRALCILKEHERSHPVVEITYFKPDRRKAGGSYDTLHAKLLRIDEFERIVILEDQIKIPFDKISAISSLVLTDEE